MTISKCTLPSVSGGLMNPAFVYRSAASTDVRATFARAKAQQALVVAPRDRTVVRALRGGAAR